ncbi:GNAT family N-acetyltransferase [Congregibacter sp.]|uniref:GNAT family N-acetyltransferase n=1 Tax=Congregibacter sp. TaxID=2744308 RepID=UPI003F6D7141
MRSFAVTPHLRLEPLLPAHREALFACVDRNREHLKRWLIWLDKTQSVDDTSLFIETEIEKRRAGTAAAYALMWDSELCGLAGFNAIDKCSKEGEIGYWLDESYVGRGVITQAVETLCSLGFGTFGLEGIEIHCATGNTRSRRVAERLGAKLMRIEKDAALLNACYVDHAVYRLDRMLTVHEG